jgi:hypothetical protein
MSSKVIVEVLVAYHKNSKIISAPGYRPIHVGAENSQTILPFLRDDSSVDNISKWNREFCELSATYWAWKNSNVHIIGINHYRRVFSRFRLSKSKIFFTSIKYKIAKSFSFKFNETSNFAFNVQLSTDLLNEKQIINKLNSKGLIVPEKYYLSRKVKVHFSLDAVYIDLLIDVVTNHSNSLFRKVFLISLDQNYLYPCNVIISKREEFNGYCEIIFPLLFKHKEICLSKGLNYFRVAGYMGEVLTNAFIQYKKYQGYKLFQFKLAYLE